MADLCDKAQELIDADLERNIKAARVEFQPGYPGDCDLCGEWSGRLVAGTCAPCRDRYKLP